MWGPAFGFRQVGRYAFDTDLIVYKEMSFYSSDNANFDISLSVWPMADLSLANVLSCTTEYNVTWLNFQGQYMLVVRSKVPWTTMEMRATSKKKAATWMYIFKLQVHAIIIIICSQVQLS